MKSSNAFLVLARVLAALAVITIARQSAKAVEPPASQTCATRFTAGCPTKCLKRGDRFDLEATTDAPFGQFVITDESQILSDLTLSAASPFGQTQTRSFVISGSGSGTATIQFVSRDENNNVCGTATCQIVAGASCPPCTATLDGCPVRCVNVGATITLAGTSSTGKGEFAPVFGFPTVVAAIPMANPWFNQLPIYSRSQGQSYTVVGPGTTMIEYRAIDEEGYVCDTEVCYIHAEDPCTTNPNDPPPPTCDLSVELVGCPQTPAKPHAIVPLEFFAYPDGIREDFSQPYSTYKDQREYTFFWCVYVTDPDGQCTVHYCPNPNIPCPYSPDCPLGEVSTGFLNKLVLRAHPKWPQIRDMLKTGSLVHVSVKVRKLGCEACTSCYFEVADGAGLTNGSDYDQDGYCDLEEVEAGSNPEDANSIPDSAYYADNDNDLVPKIYDVRTPPTADVQSTEEHFDTDKDGVIDFAEMDLGLDPYNPKSTVASDGTPIPDINSAAYTAPGVDDDRDMLYDEYEAHYGFNPNNADTDADGIPDGVEVRTGTDPFTNHHHESVDSDGDGLSDYEERLYYKSNTNDYDSDNDGLPDFFEVKAGFDPTKERSLGASSLPDGMLDLDGDGLSNADEYMYGTDALSNDMDGDGISDGDEIRQGSDPRDRGSMTARPYATIRVHAISNQRDKAVSIKIGHIIINVPPDSSIDEYVNLPTGQYDTNLLTSKKDIAAQASDMRTFKFTYTFNRSYTGRYHPDDSWIDIYNYEERVVSTDTFFTCYSSPRSGHSTVLKHEVWLQKSKYNGYIQTLCDLHTSGTYAFPLESPCNGDNGGLCRGQYPYSHLSLLHQCIDYDYCLKFACLKRTSGSWSDTFLYLDDGSSHFLGDYLQTMSISAESTPRSYNGEITRKGVLVAPS